MWNVTDWNLGTHGFVSRDNDPTFRTELIIYPLYDYTRHALQHSHASLVYYPFDRCGALSARVIYLMVFTRYVTIPKYLLLLKTHQRTNQSPWSLIQRLDSSCKLPRCLSSRTDRSSFSDLKITTNVVGEDITYWDLDPEKAAIDVYVTLQRSNLIIVYCLIITSTFCSSSLPYMYCPHQPSVHIRPVTLMICLIMIATVIFGFRQRNEIVVVPIGTVFAFTQLRSAMPGPPDGFGMPFAFLSFYIVLIKTPTPPGDILGTDRFIFSLPSPELSLLIQILLGYYPASSFCPFRCIYLSESYHSNQNA